MYLKSQIKYLTKLGKELKLPYRQFSYALQSFNLIVRKQKGNQCGVCGSLDRVTIHHLFYKYWYPQLSLNVNNGIPLCKIHHNEIHYKFSKSPPLLTSILSREHPVILI